jgi:hypothetical protein
MSWGEEDDASMLALPGCEQLWCDRKQVVHTCSEVVHNSDTCEIGCEQALHCCDRRLPAHQQATRP